MLKRNATATILGRGVGLSFYSDNATKMAQIFTQTTDSANTSRGSLTLDTTFCNIILSPNNGYVGIGTTSPGVKLQVEGAIRGGSFSNSTTNSAEAWFGRAADRALGTMTFQLGGTTATNTRFEIVDRA